MKALTDDPEAEVALDEVATSAPVGLALMDVHGQMSWVNAAAEQILGRTRAELGTGSLYHLLHPDDRDMAESLIHQILDGRLSQSSAIHRLQHGDGSYMEVNVHVGRHASQELVVLALDRLKGLRELERRAARLERSNAELEQFAYAASHDLQEPLRMIRSFGQLLERTASEALGDKQRHYLDRVVQGAARMQGLIDDLLAFSRVSTRRHPFQTCDLGEVLEQVRRDLELRLRETGGALEVGELPEVRGDATQLHQVLANLVSNGLKFAGDRPPRVAVSAARVPGAWRIEVRDQGIGIEARHVDRIFDVFRRLHTREEYPGNGIGLAVVKRIVQRHGGHVWVASEPGEGSSFFFTLPDDAEDEENPGARPETESEDP